MGYRYDEAVDDNGNYMFVNMLSTFKEMLHNNAIRQSIWMTRVTYPIN